jgi:hypothetical protein
VSSSLAKWQNNTWLATGLDGLILTTVPSKIPYLSQVPGGGLWQIMLTKAAGVLAGNA